MFIPRVSITDSTAESVAGKNKEKPGTAHSAKPKPVKALRIEARRNNGPQCHHNTERSS